MILRLFPQRPDHPLADGKELKRILGELHVERPANAIEEVSSWIESLRQAPDFRVDLYFDVLRQLDEVAQPHLRHLLRDYFQARISPVERQRLWTLCHGYWREASAGYALAVDGVQLAAAGRAGDALRALLPIAATRLQGARCARAKWLAYRHEMPDEDFWRALGQTYLAAEQSAYSAKPTPLYPGQQGLTSVAQQTVSAVVFSISATDRLLPLQIELADRLITHCLPGFALLSGWRAECVYWIDTASGVPPVRVAVQPGPARAGLRFLSSAPACATLGELIQLFEHGELPPGINLGGQYPAGVIVPVARHLAEYWNPTPPTRRHQRHAVRTRMAVIAGFEASYAIFSANAPRPLDPAGIQSWVVENVSRGGFLAIRDETGPDTMGIGSLLCLQAEGGDNWLLGSVRRLVRVPGGLSRVGIQVLSRQAQSVELRPRRSGFAAALPGIWLREAVEPGVLRIVLPAGSFKVRESMELGLPERTRVLTPLDLESTGGDYEIGRFRE